MVSVEERDPRSPSTHDHLGSFRGGIIKCPDRPLGLRTVRTGQRGWGRGKLRDDINPVTL